MRECAYACVHVHISWTAEPNLGGQAMLQMTTEDFRNVAQATIQWRSCVQPESLKWYGASFSLEYYLWLTKTS